MSADSFVHLPSERWAVIPEFPDYDVSTLGRVASRRRGGMEAYYAAK